MGRAEDAARAREAHEANAEATERLREQHTRDAEAGELVSSLRSKIPRVLALLEQREFPNATLRAVPPLPRRFRFGTTRWPELATWELFSERGFDAYSNAIYLVSDGRLMVTGSATQSSWCSSLRPDQIVEQFADEAALRLLKRANSGLDRMAQRNV